MAQGNQQQDGHAANRYQKIAKNGKTRGGKRPGRGFFESTRLNDECTRHHIIYGNYTTPFVLMFYYKHTTGHKNTCRLFCVPLAKKLEKMVRRTLRRSRIRSCTSWGRRLGPLRSSLRTSLAKSLSVGMKSPSTSLWPGCLPGYFPASPTRLHLTGKPSPQALRHHFERDAEA